MTDINPDLFLSAVLGYQKTAAIKAALALDIFTAITRGSGDARDVARQTGASPRGIRILCDYLTIQGFLEKQGERYQLTESTKLFLTTSSPAWMGSVVDFLASPEMISLWLDDPVSYVRNGGSVGLANLASDNPVWVKFAKAMVPLVSPAARAIAADVSGWPVPPRKVLDVAAGHGIFGISLAQAIPKVEVTVIDWQGVLVVAEENAAQAGVSERYRAIAGSAFDVDWGGDFDLVLLTNFLHHFDEQTCIGLLARAKNSLTPSGRALAVELVPNDDRVTPPFAASFAFIMLGSTPRGDAYTARQFDEMARKAGFTSAVVKDLPPSPLSLVTFEKG
jgi:2-polyprenyl-3-methyl-5-hydroxy-6-metoxy-1,4-benzoquinol methylase